MNAAFRWVTVVVVLTAGLAWIGWGWWGTTGAGEADLDLSLLHTVSRGDFEATVTEPGDLQSASNIEIRCEVESKGRAGSAILEIVDEGTQVKQGDFLVQFDDSVLKDELIAQRIQVANDRAAVIQAESDLDTAERALQEYEQGTFEQERAVIEAEVAFAEETLRRAEEYFRHSQKLGLRGYVTDSQLEADAYAVVKARKELELARQKLQVFERFTKQRMIAELSAEIEKQKANLEAAEFTLQLSQTREREIGEQITKCRVVAPAEGMVVYANDSDRGDSSIVIEEGALIRDGQPIIRLPDPEQMEVITHINDSKINLVAKDDPALIWLDTDPENPVRGEVSRVANFPLPRRWYQAPIEYEVFVRVTESSPAVRPGLRGKVQIFVEQASNVLQVPVSSIVRHQESYFVLAFRDGELVPREVVVGPNNGRFVVIQQGLEEGERVVIDAELHRNRVEFPEVTELAGESLASLPASSPR